MQIVNESCDELKWISRRILFLNTRYFGIAPVKINSAILFYLFLLLPLPIYFTTCVNFSLFAEEITIQSLKSTVIKN